MLAPFCLAEHIFGNARAVPPIPGERVTRACTEPLLSLVRYRGAAATAKAAPVRLQLPRPAGADKTAMLTTGTGLAVVLVGDGTFESLETPPNS